MSTMLSYKFGLQRINNRYSTPNSFRGRKISCQNMNRTMKLKLKKIDEIRSARSQMELYNEKKEQNEIQYFQEKEFFRTHSRVLRAKVPSQLKAYDFDSTQLHIRPKKKEEKKIERPKAYYYSPNLQEKMNIHLNNLINRSQQDHKEKLKIIENRMEDNASNETTTRKTSLNTHNMFWKKMKRAVSQRRQKIKEEPFANVNSYSIKLDLLS